MARIVRPGGAYDESMPNKEGRNMEKDVDDFIFEDCESRVSDR